MRFLLLTLVLWMATGPAVAHADPIDSVRRTPVVDAVARATPAVVAIEVEVEVRNPFLLFGQGVGRGEGSGVIIADDGTVLTNAHVVDGATALTVVLADGRRFPARVVALDASADLAVLKVSGAESLPVLPLGDSDALMLGETAIAIGNPLGLGLTVSTGVIASTARDLSVGDGPVQTWIQTDAAINPGNSGGALIDLEGRLIGINTFIRADAQGIGFAIPVNRARKVAADLLAFGEVQQPWLGVTVVDVPARGSVGFRGHPGAGSAALLRAVEPGGPGAKAGLRPGDVVLQVDGHKVHSRADLNARLAERRPGDTVALVLNRGRGQASVRVQSSGLPRHLGSGILSTSMGVDLRPTRGGLLAEKVVPDGHWVRAGLQQGDVLVAVDGRPVPSLREVVEALDRALARHRPTVWVTVARGRYRGTLELTL